MVARLIELRSGPSPKTALLCAEALQAEFGIKVTRDAVTTKLGRLGITGRVVSGVMTADGMLNPIDDPARQGALAMAASPYAPGVEDGQHRTSGDGALLQQLSPNAHRVVVPGERRAGWRKLVLLTADHHHDHVDCWRDLIAHEHDQAVKENAGIIAIGDVFCAMQGKQDRRGSKVELRESLRVPDYTDALVDQAEEFYAPWAANYWMMSLGNHETSFASLHETRLLHRLVRRLNRRAGSGTILGAYQGYLSIDIDSGEDLPPQRFRIMYDHGTGGGGPVTLGVIRTNRVSASDDFDVFVTGHVHQKWTIPIARRTVREDGKVVVRDVHHICCGSYKVEGLSGVGWHVETGKPAKPLGGWWLEIYWSEFLGQFMARTLGVVR